MPLKNPALPGFFCPALVRAASLATRFFTDCGAHQEETGGRFV
jgi:hypothetical protein